MRYPIKRDQTKFIGVDFCTIKPPNHFRTRIIQFHFYFIILFIGGFSFLLEAASEITPLTDREWSFNMFEGSIKAKDQIISASGTGIRYTHNNDRPFCGCGLGLNLLQVSNVFDPPDMDEENPWYLWYLNQNFRHKERIYEPFSVTFSFGWGYFYGTRTGSHFYKRLPNFKSEIAIHSQVGFFMNKKPWDLGGFELYWQLFRGTRTNSYWGNLIALAVLF